MSTEVRPEELPELLEKLAGGEPLTSGQAEAVFDRFMDGSASEVQMAAVLMAMRVRGVAPSEIAGGVRALRKAMIPVASADPDVLIDTAGTGGGSITTFNISTAAAFVAAGAGAMVAKHGNRSFTSKSGSADVLEEMGIRIDLTPDQMATVLREAGIVFMFAPLLHPAMRHVGPVRRALGVRTVMNVLGPLTNPAGARRQVIGVADPQLLDLVPNALLELDHIRALVVHGSPGMDEVSPMGSTRVVELKDGQLRDYVLDLAEMGLEPVDARALEGGYPPDNAHIIDRVLSGDHGGGRTATVVNAAAAILVADLAESWSDAAEMAMESIDSGRAAEAHQALQRASQAQ